MKLFSLVCAIVIMSLCGALRTKVTKLNNGILLQESGTIRVKVANYQLFLTQNKPSRFHWTAASTVVAHNLNRYANTLGIAPTNWISRYTLVTRLLSSVHTRSKRGWINFVGKASKFLFGTATTGDVDTIKRNLDEITDRESIVRHQVN